MTRRHTLSALWGDMPDSEYAELVESVREHGLLDPVITMLGGEVLDGWHRARAAVDTGRKDELVQREYEGDDPVGFVIGRNAQRRHLTASQRAAIVVACHEWASRGRQAQMDHDGPFATTAAMAEEVSVSPTTIKRAKAAERAGLGDAVRAGEIPAHKAAQQARGEPDTPKQPSRMQRLEAELDAARLELSAKVQRVEDLEEELRFLRGEGAEYDHEREATFHRQQATIGGLRASLATCNQKHGDEQRRSYGLTRALRRTEEEKELWESRAKELGWQS